MRDVTPPSDPPDEIPRPQSVGSDAQPEGIARSDTGMQTEYKYDLFLSPPVSDWDRAYNELLEKNVRLQQDNTELLHQCQVLQHESTTYKNALDILTAKYRKDKIAWKAWTEHDQARREMTKKRKQDSNKRRISTPIHKPYNTPAMTSSPPRPPILSPDNSPVKSTAVVEPMFTDKLAKPVRKGGLFSGLQPSKMARFPKELDRMPDVDRKTLGMDPIPSHAPSISEAMEQGQPQLPPPAGQVATATASRTITGTVDIIPSDATTSDSGDDMNEITPKAKSSTAERRQGSILPSPKAQRKPMASSREGASWAQPVVIKSEPQSSQSDPGYHLYEQESLDLDDVGVEEKQGTPRKRRKLGSSNSGGVVIRQEDPDADMLPNDLNDINDLPALPGIQLSHFTDEDVLPPPRPRPSDMLKTPARKTLNQAQQKSPRPSARRGPIATSTSAKRDNCSHSKALVHVLEDGTDGENATNLGKAIPDVRTNTRLDDLLSTPVPRSPSLRALGKETINARSAPPKKRDVFTTPSNPAAAVAKRHADTDPLPPGKRTADARGAQTKKPVRLATTSVNDISRFAINPAINGGLDYAYHEVVRKKEQRKCLPGCTRACCRDVGNFVEAAGLPLAEKRGPRWRSSSPAGSSQMREEEQQFVQKYGRHREAHPRRRTPPFFWESEMLDTQALKEQHEEADRREREKVEMRRKEAEKENGRFVYKR
jgi:hypothetical protein